MKIHIIFHLPKKFCKWYPLWFLEAQWIYTFTCKKLIYVWDSERCEYLKLRGLDTGVLCSNLHQMSGLNSAQQAMRRGVYGNNEIVVPVKGFFTLLVLEVLNPFYVFQLLSFCLWMIDNYYYYAMVILGMTSCGVVMAVVQTRRVSYRIVRFLVWLDPSRLKITME